MKEKLTFITASAGTGKTYQLVRTVREAVAGGTTRPEGIIATTFTRAAAEEMRERLSLAFHGEGLHDEAGRLERDALISTVHGVCFRLLTRFAFEAGISPDIRVLDESEAKLLLDRSIEEVVDEKTLQELYALAERLGQRNQMTWELRWRGQVKEIVEAARSNDIDPDDLPGMGAASWDEMREVLGEAIGADLDRALLEEIESFLAESEGATQNNTAKYRSLLEAFRSRMMSRAFRWSNWERLVHPDPGKDFRQRANRIASVAERVGTHPRLQKDLKRYLTLLFQLARDAGAHFAELKAGRGAVDYPDMEKACLDLLRGSGKVRDILSGEVELLLVDEFQDTSPIQLALLTELGGLADRVVWVGDVKQSIYGFSGADPSLGFQAVRGAARKETLDVSRRSVPDLVTLTNHLFAPAFRDAIGLAEEETRVSAHRCAREGTEPALEVADITTGEQQKNGKTRPLSSTRRSAVVAEVVSNLLRRGGQPVTEKSTITETDRIGESRALSPRDIAVLVRRNQTAGQVARQLRARGLDVSLTGSGLLATPEANFALSCLRRWIDPSDSLAAAEIVSFERLHEVEDWLEDRLRHVAEREESEFADPWVPESSPALKSLHEASRDDDLRDFRSPLETFDRALAAAGAARIVSRWGPGETRAAQRLANLEQLHVMIEEYEDRAAAFGVPVTLNGLFGWLDDMGAAGEDKLPSMRSGDAVTVSTYHGAKGLEWPLVILGDLDAGLEPRLYSLRVLASSGREEVDYADPLAGRELRLWIHPFGGRWGKSVPHPLVAGLENSTTGKAALEDERCEALRLLYVGFTRARDRLVLLHAPAGGTAWLDILAAGAGEAIRGESGAEFPVAAQRSSHVPAAAEESVVAESLSLPVSAPGKTPRVSARVIPSEAPPRAGAAILRTEAFGHRLTWTGHPDERDLGDAMHRILAASVTQADLSSGERESIIGGILASFGLDAHLLTCDVAKAVAGYRRHIAESLAPVAEQVEVPFTVTNGEGQRIAGFIDHLLVLPDGSRVIIDHKIFPGKKAEWEGKALSFSGQLALYAEAVGGAPPPRTFIHLVTAGALIEVGSFEG